MWPESPGEPLTAIGCMRLSTEPDRDEARAIAVLHAALDAGVRLLDTADAYCWDTSEAGHNERLIARALDRWSGDPSGVLVATKGGVTRPDGRWVPDGRARHLAAACRASRAALGVERLALYNFMLQILEHRCRRACARSPRCRPMAWSTTSGSAT